nr:NADH dehydrogenase subunit 4L [Nionia sp.]
MSNFFVCYVFFSSLFCMILIRKHILLCMMSLEFIVLSILILMIFYCLMFSNSFYIYIFFMTFYVCEGALGLSVLVNMIRCHGNDYLNSLLLW